MAEDDPAADEVNCDVCLMDDKFDTDGCLLSPEGMTKLAATLVTSNPIRAIVAIKEKKNNVKS